MLEDFDDDPEAEDDVGAGAGCFRGGTRGRDDDDDERSPTSAGEGSNG